MRWSACWVPVLVGALAIVDLAARASSVRKGQSQEASAVAESRRVLSHRFVETVLVRVSDAIGVRIRV